jgi:HEPN domain-containing protein
MNVAIVREWLDHVQEDLDAAWSCARGERAAPGQAAYHVQQAAEKLIKSVLIAHELRPPHTHDIAALCHLLPDDAPSREALLRLRRFTSYAFVFRYPTDDVPERRPDPGEIDTWIGEIERLKRDVEGWLQAQSEDGC